MPIRRGSLGGAVALLPTITGVSVTNFNQSIATLNATIDCQGYLGTGYFDYSTSSSFTTYSSVALSSLQRTSTTVYSNVTGLTEDTTYYVRVRATNDVGTTTSSSVSFATWKLWAYERTSSGGVSLTIPTVTPTGGSVVAVSIYDIIMFGGGGAGNAGGGGGGGYVSQASQSLSGNRVITTSVGGGGIIDSDGFVYAGSASTITGDITTLTAAGSGATSSNFNGSSSGNGYSGGAPVTYDGVPPDSKGNNSTNIGYGGGGGAGGNGSNGSAGSFGATGGNGGIGVSITRGGVTIEGGAGGGGGSQNNESGTASQGSVGTYNTYGSGGKGRTNLNVNNTAGVGGYIRFRYYASASLT